MTNAAHFAENYDETLGPVIFRPWPQELIACAQAVTLEHFAGADAASAVRAICGFPDADAIRALFVEAGLKDIYVDNVSLTFHHPDAHAYAKGAMGGMHTGDKLGGLSPEEREAAFGMFVTELGDCYDGRAMTFPHVSNVVTAQI